jgi:hypothetical protein
MIIFVVFLCTKRRLLNFYNHFLRTGGLCICFTVTFLSNVFSLNWRSEAEYWYNMPVTVIHPSRIRYPAFCITHINVISLFIISTSGRIQTYLETKLTDQDCREEEIKNRQYSGNDCYHWLRVIFLPPADKKRKG